MNCEELHRLFCFHARQTLPFPHFRFRWEAWATMEGHTKENLLLVLNYITWRRLTASEEKYKPAFALNKLLDDHGWFACQVQATESHERTQAAKRRQPTDYNRQAVLKATGRATGPKSEPVTPAQVLLVPVSELVAAMRRETA